MRFESDAFPAVLAIMKVCMDTKALLHRQAVEELYDDYAETFEEHLVERLEYRGPDIIAGLLEQFAVLQGLGDLSTIIDLGCGTGLCGSRVRRFTPRLVGIDVSEGMLALARAKGIDGNVGGPGQLYDELLAMDAVVGLAKQRPGSVDHIIAGDMFIYVWSVERVLQACAVALRHNGTLIFTTESMEEGECEKGWIKRESERFAHSRTFITRLCEQQGFKLEHCGRVSLRREAQSKALTAECAGDIDGVQLTDDARTSTSVPVSKARFLPADVFVARKL